MKTLDQIYRKNSRTQAYVIEVKINRFDDLFNDLDPSPFRRRDLDQDFITYMDDSSRDIPIKHPLEIEIFCSKQKENREMEERIKLGVKSYYQFLQTNQKRFMRNRFRDSLLYLGLALLSLFLSFYFNRTLNTSYLSKILIEGFNIGGWVFFWEFLALSVFKSRSQRKELARAKRIELGKLTFFYSPSLQ